MKTGTIKKVMPKGFGFISVQGSSKDLFFHARDVGGVAFDQLREGDEVEFEVEDGEKGPKAINVQLINQ